jgi:mannose PTS system EIIA component
MIGLLILAHAPLASALAQAAAHVYTCAPERAGRQVRIFDVPADCDVEATVAHCRALIAEIDSGAGCLVLVDTAGATPGNIAEQLAVPARVGVVAGVSLPMLLRVLCYRDDPLTTLVDKALTATPPNELKSGPAPVQNQAQRAQVHDQARLHHQQ